MDNVINLLLVIMLIVLFGGSAIFIIRNLIIKINIYEQWIRDFSLTIEAVNTELDRLDTDGIFRSDDEIGFFFQAMYSILTRLTEYGIVVNMIGDEIKIPDKELRMMYSKNKELKRRIDKRRDKMITIESVQKKVFGGVIHDGIHDGIVDGSGENIIKK